MALQSTIIAITLIYVCFRKSIARVENPHYNAADKKEQTYRFSRDSALCVTPNVSEPDINMCNILFPTCKGDLQQIGCFWFHARERNTFIFIEIYAVFLKHAKHY